jgi:hypothetical protein
MTHMHSIKRLIGLALIAGTVVACGDVARQGRAPVYLVVTLLTASAGPKGAFGNPLLSDVQTAVPAGSTPGIYDDLGQVTFAVTPKNVLTTAPTTNNWVTVTRYHVSYRRADGRNVPGIDVPYPFDAGMTITIPASADGTSAAPFAFEIVRHVAKAESPLVQLTVNHTVISTIADVTFYGADQVGNDISVTASMQINFGDFADPTS